MARKQSRRESAAPVEPAAASERSLGDNLTLLEGELQELKLQTERLRGQVERLEDSLARIAALSSSRKAGREAERLIEIGDIARRALGKR